MHFLLLYLWIAPHILLAVSLAIFLRGGLEKQFPFFFAYALFELIQFLTLIADYVMAVLNPGHPLNLYRWMLVWGLGVSSVLSFGVIYELVNQTILARSTLADALRPVWRWSAVVVVLLTAVTSARLASNGIERVMSVFRLLDYSSSVLQVGFLMVLFLCSRLLRISWRSFSVGIALGLGIGACIELSAAALLPVFGVHRYALLDALRLGAFHVCVLIWLCYLIFPKREPKFAGKLVQKSELEFWDQELQRMVQR